MIPFPLALALTITTHLERWEGSLGVVFSSLFEVRTVEAVLPHDSVLRCCFTLCILNFLFFRLLEEEEKKKKKRKKKC